MIVLQSMYQIFPEVDNYREVYECGVLLIKIRDHAKRP